MGRGAPPVEYSDPKDIDQLHITLRYRLKKAMADFKAEGGLYAQLVSGKRTDYMQYLLRLGRVPRGEEWNPAYPGYPLTAVPGRSDHRNISQDISAADIGGTAFKRWLRARQKKYGVLFNISSEDWHIIPYGTPQVNVNYSPAPKPAPKPTPPKPAPTRQEPFTVAQYDDIDDKLTKILNETTANKANLEILQSRIGFLEGVLIETKAYAREDAYDDLETAQEKVELQAKVNAYANAEKAKLKAARAR